MRISSRTLIGFATASAMVLALGASPAFAQAPPPQPQQKPTPQERAPQQKAPAQQTSPIEGDLVSVDAKAQMITVKAENGQNVQVRYTDKTEVSGAQQGVAGLATLKEGRVTIHFTEDASKTKTATRIIVQPKK